MFVQPCDGRDFIKRIVATEGQTVEVRCNVLYVDGKASPFEHLPDANHCPYWNIGPDADPSVEKNWLRM